MQEAAGFFHTAIRRFGASTPSGGIKVLDVGTGRGRLVQAMMQAGLDAYGCDIQSNWGADAPDGRFAVIESRPYLLPYADGSFDVVLSTSVLEHVRDKMAAFREFHRVLKPGGLSMHLFPSKWYLPTEPHLYVPLLNYFWPRPTRPWLAMWALAGVRNEYQVGKSWREVVALNEEYCANGISYWPLNRYRRLSESVFGNFATPMDFYIEQAGGGIASRLRRLPFRRATGALVGALRMRFIVQHKR